ncbi:MAG: hypothetical protein ACRCXC_08730 [Legionella sp.]
MLTSEQAQQLIERNSVYPSKSTEKTTVAQTSSGKTFQEVMFGGSTSKIARTLFKYLSDKDRANLAAVCVDTRRLDKVDRALTDVDFKIALMSEILAVLENPQYAAQLTVSRNPSGFLRLNNDLIKLIKNPELLKALPDAAVLRLNFWPGDLYKHLGAKLEPETGHSHPRGFASFIVTGGYKHDIHFSADNPKDPGFMVFKGIVDKSGKRFEKQEGAHHLAHVLREKVEPSSGYAYFSPDMIHQVHERIPASYVEMDHGTLSINVVFDALKSKPAAEYNLYINDEGSLVERYGQLEPSLAQATLTIVTGLLKDKINELSETRKEKTVKASSSEKPKVSNNSSTLFGRKDSFDVAIEALNAERDENIALPDVTNHEKTPEAIKTETLSKGITVTF